MPKAMTTKSDIILIAKRCIEDYDGKLVRRLDAQDLALGNQDNVLQIHTLQLNDIKNQITEIYGNGSGRKGILDRMGETQATQAGVLAALQATVVSEKQSQELFRVEVRNALKIRDVTDDERVRTNNTWIRWLKYLVTPIGVAVWELLKAHFHIGEKIR